ncbi:hypothetical protein GQ53DRAFT_589883, partial [Thozetella sp. PMI_491]
RSNSTTAAPVSTRSRIFGHFRTSSSSSTASTTARLGTPSSRSNSHETIASTANSNSSSSTAHAASPSLPGPAAVPHAPGAATPRAEQHQHQHQPRYAERMSAANKYYQDKELPSTPRLETHEAASKYFSAVGSASEPSSARTPLSATSASNPFTSPRLQTGPGVTALSAGQSGIYGLSPVAASSSGKDAFNRTESVSSTSGVTTLSSRTMLSSEPPSSNEWTAPHHIRPFVVRNGRTYVSDHTLAYPFPVDLPELHRQTLRTLMLYQLYGAPVCSPALLKKPPMRVLEVGCGSGFWSMTCHRYYARRGHTDISFTGIDIAPLAPGASGRGTSSISGGSRASISSLTDSRPDKEMKWRFVQHDIRRTPWPFQDGEFDLVFVKDMSSSTTLAHSQMLMDEYIRVLTPGGTLELWDHDLSLRMLRPHVPESGAVPQDQDDSGSGEDESSSEEEDEDKVVANLGAYVMTANTPLSAPTNQFLLEYNAWLSKALEPRGLTPVPCAFVGPSFLQEADSLTGLGSRRLAIPLSEVRWEREGVGGVVTKDGKSYIATRGKAKAGQEPKTGGKGLKPGAAALRRTALMTVVQMIQSLEPLIREGSGKSQDEWDNWLGKMMNDLLKENGTSWGECLEVGAWWAKKK